MRCARLGDAGLVVSRLGFGAMTFGSDRGPLGAVWKAGFRASPAVIGSRLSCPAVSAR